MHHSVRACTPFCAAPTPSAPTSPHPAPRRYVGELSLLEPRRDVLRFSVLDVWGNREDVDVPLGALTPPFRNMAPKAADAIAGQLLFPVNTEVPGKGRRQFYVSVVAGQLLDAATVVRLMKGEYVPPSSGGDAGGGGDAGSSSGKQVGSSSGAGSTSGAGASGGSSGIDSNSSSGANRQDGG